MCQSTRQSAGSSLVSLYNNKLLTLKKNCVCWVTFAFVALCLQSFADHKTGWFREEYLNKWISWLCLYMRVQVTQTQFIHSHLFSGRSLGQTFPQQGLRLFILLNYSIRPEEWRDGGIFITERYKRSEYLRLTWSAGLFSEG